MMPLGGLREQAEIKRELGIEFAKVLNRNEYIAPVNKNDLPRPTFQKALRLCVLIGQCFGLNPVLGVCENDSRKLRFNLFSGRCFYTFLSIVGQLFNLSLCVLKLAKMSNGSLSSSTSLVFYGTNCLTTIVFVRIAMKWPKLIEHISKLDATDPILDSGLVRRCNISCIVVLCLALVEHTLSHIAGIAVAIDCQPNTNLYEAFILESFPWVWASFYYNPVLGLFIQFINFQATFNWNFADAFVICISLYLTARLKQVNDRIAAGRGKHVTAYFWRTLREDYCKATSLVRKVDDVISCIIFISFADNLFFICLQFLHILEFGLKALPACHRISDARPLRGYEEAVYLVFSFGFLIARSLAVSLIAAQVHTASKLPAQSLYDVPSASYCVEVQRLIEQVHGDTVALSGLQFFNVKRGLVLTIVGTIITYELVLMQFTGVSPSTAPPTVTPSLPSAI